MRAHAVSRVDLRGPRALGCACCAFSPIIDGVETTTPDAQADEDDSALVRSLRPHTPLERWLGREERHELTRFVLLRLLGFVYAAAFASLVWQVVPLIGEHGLMPASAHVQRSIATAGSALAAFRREPSLFVFLPPSDAALSALAWLGLALSIGLMLGLTHAAVMFVLWALYRSFIAAGQLWYGYGWELLLVETGFAAIFLCPLESLGPFPRARVPLPLIWVFRWLACRVMLGAGLIKLRGDPCWRDLTCLDFHFETQPLPNPLSPLFHALPHSVHAGGVVFNHLCELLFPLCLFGPRRLRHAAGLAMISFQGILILSGNLSFLNWLTIVPLLASFDDRLLARVMPRRLVARAAEVETHARAQGIAAAILTCLVAVLSVEPTLNLLSPRQRMNAAYEPLMLVNSYGAFGSVGRERPELIIEGTRAQEPDADAHWEAYELPFKPGDPERGLGVVSPLQPRLDWQIWFAAMASAEDEPWMLHVVWKLLHADRGLRRLLARDPFGDDPPRYVRVMRYRYRFAPRGSRAVWVRELEGYWLPPLPADEILRDAMRQLGYAE